MFIIVVNILSFDLYVTLQYLLFMLLFLLFFLCLFFFFFFFSSRRRHTSLVSDWSSDVCSSDLGRGRLEHPRPAAGLARLHRGLGMAKPGRVSARTRRGPGVPAPQVESRARLPAHQGDLGLRRESDRGALRLRVARRFGSLVPLLRQRELGVRRARSDAPAHRLDQRPADPRDRAQVPVERPGPEAQGSSRVERPRPVTRLCPDRPRGTSLPTLRWSAETRVQAGFALALACIAVIGGDAAGGRSGGDRASVRLPVSSQRDSAGAGAGSGCPRTSRARARARAAPRRPAGRGSAGTPGSARTGAPAGSGTARRSPRLLRPLPH